MTAPPEENVYILILLFSIASQPGRHSGDVELSVGPGHPCPGPLDADWPRVSGVLGLGQAHSYSWRSGIWRVNILCLFCCPHCPWLVIQNKCLT